MKKWIKIICGVAIVLIGCLVLYLTTKVDSCIKQGNNIINQQIINQNNNDVPIYAEPEKQIDWHDYAPDK